MVGWPVWGGFGANPLPTRYEREWKELKAQWQGGFPYSEGIFEDINKVLFASFYWKADTTADEALREYIAFEYSPEVVDLVLPAIHMLEKNVPSGRTGPWSLEGARPDGAGRRAAHTASAPGLAVADPLLASPSGCAVVPQPRSDAGPGPPRCLPGVDPHLPRAERRACRQAAAGRSDRAARDHPPARISMGRSWLRRMIEPCCQSKPMAYWRMDEVAGDVLEDASGNAHSAACEAGVEFSPPTGPTPANPAAVFWGGRISAAIDHLPDAYSVELWVRNELPPTARPITAYFFSRGVDGPQGRAGGDNLGIGGTHRLPRTKGSSSSSMARNATRFYQAEPTCNRGRGITWSSCAKVESISVYLDGGRDPEICGQAEIGYSAGCGQLFFGGRNDGFAPLEGKLDEVSVYNRALRVDEIAAHYAASPPQPEADC